MTAARFVPLDSWREYSAEEMRRRAIFFRDEMRRRRSVRHFARWPVSTRGHQGVLGPRRFGPERSQYAALALCGGE